MTFSNIGKKRHMDRLFTNGKTLIVPVDDSLIFGPYDGLNNIRDTLGTILKTRPNAVLGFKKDLQIVTEIDSSVPFIYNATASTVLSQHTKKIVIGDVEQLVSAGIDCIAAHVNFSSKYTNDLLKNFADIVNACDRFGIPCLAIAYPRREAEDGTDYNYEDVKGQEEFTRLVQHIVRIAGELGADIIKTYYTGSIDSFKEVVSSAVGIPVVIAGGPKVDIAKSLSVVEGAMSAGAAGISYGRNVFNADNIESYLEQLKLKIFGDYRTK